MADAVTLASPPRPGSRDDVRELEEDAAHRFLEKVRRPDDYHIRSVVRTDTGRVTALDSETQKRTAHCHLCWHVSCGKPCCPQRNETMTIREMRDALREIDVDANGKICFIEYCLFKYKKTLTVRKNYYSIPRGHNR